MTTAAQHLANGQATGKDEKEKGAMDPHKIKAFRTALPQILAVSAKNILLLGYGMTLGFPTIVIPNIQHNSNSTDVLRLSVEEISWFSSINLICVPLGCLVSGAVTQPLGRKKAMIFINLPFVAAWLMFHYAESLALLYCALALTGFSGGLLEAPVLTYVAEITQPHLRGMLSATSSMCVILGVFIQFFMGNFWYWRTVAAVNVAFPILAIIGLSFVPESPHWLVSKGRLPEAEKSLCWLRGWVDPSHVREEFAHLVESLSASRKGAAGDSSSGRGSWRNYTKRTFLMPYLLVSASFFFGHFSGMTTLQTYAVTIFSTLGAPIDKYLATLYLGVVELAGTLLCVVLIHWTGKRPLVFVSTIGNGICFVVVATYAFVLRDSELTADNPYSWVPMTFLLGAAFLSHFCIRLLPWVLIGEVYPAEVRGVASGASGSVGYIFGFAANKMYFHMLGGLTLYGTFWFYGAVSFLGCIFLYLLLPETEGRTLHEIEQHFSGAHDLLNEKKVIHVAPADIPITDKYAAANPALVLEDVESHL
ncbi:facilitated trehalose transporter Tret1 [Anabrus simplex]|uniref:facilitated trehalose transporter Tret1 n=1 Tax=Anabrus simplex TaxID=316456 RepID=UPI0035A26DA0